MRDAAIGDLVGKVIDRVAVTDDKETLTLECRDGSVFRMYHEQDCCEGVALEDVVGELSWLEGEEVLEAREDTNDKQWPSDLTEPEYRPDSFTWTFYTVVTRKGTVVLRWLGESNGYYSENVDIVQDS